MRPPIGINPGSVGEPRPTQGTGFVEQPKLSERAALKALGILFAADQDEILFK